MKNLMSLSLLAFTALTGVGTCTNAAHADSRIALIATDSPGETSWNTGLHWEDGAAPVAGKTYVVPNGLWLRTPLSSASSTFAGDALVLEDGAKVNLKQGGNQTASAAWIAYGCQIAIGETCTMGVGGTIDVYGTADKPTSFTGSGSNGNRFLNVQASLSGASDAVVKVARTVATDGNYEAENCGGVSYGCRFSGDNSNYAGRFAASSEGGTMGLPWVIAFSSQVALGAPLADAPKLTVGDGFVVQGGALAFTNGYAVALEGNATFKGGDDTERADCSDGRYASVKYEKLYFGRGGSVTGSGSSVLTLEASPFVLADVAFSGLEKIVVTTGALRLHPDYNQTELPLDVQAPGQLVDGSLNVGPVTLKSGASIQPGFGTAVPQCLGTFGLASLTMEAGSALKMSVAQVNDVYTNDFVRVTGNLVKPATGRISVQFDVFPMSMPAGTKVALLSAANLGTDVTADDFSSTHVDPMSDALLAGVFSIETRDGVPTLVFTKTNAEPVFLMGTDTRENNSWAAAGNCSSPPLPRGAALPSSCGRRMCGLACARFRAEPRFREEENRESNFVVHLGQF